MVKQEDIYNNNKDINDSLVVADIKDVNIPNNDGLTLLHIASEKGYEKIVQKLIVDGAMINKLDKKGDNAVNIAIKNGHIELAKLLIQKGGVIESNYTINLLFTACIGGNIELIKGLINAGTDINLISKNNYNILHLALVFNQKNILTQLIELGADINSVNSDGDSLLHIALKTGDVDLINKIFKFKPNWNLKNNENKTPIMLTIEKEYMNILKALVKNKYEFEVSSFY